MWDATESVDDLPGASEIETLIAQHGDTPEVDGIMRERVAGAVLLVLGEVSLDGVRMLRCEVPVPTCLAHQPIELRPVFTRYEHVDTAIFMNPTWVSLDIVPIDGYRVLADLAPGEWLGINPWSGREFKLPPNDRRT